MKHLILAVALLATPALALASDTSANHFSRDQALTGRDIREGVVLLVREVEIDNRSKVNTGTVVGGVVGYAASANVHGNYRTPARVAGTTIGALAGGAVNNALTRRHGVEIVVRVVDERGRRSVISFVQDADQAISVGQNVLISGRGRDVRVVPLPR